MRYRYGFSVAVLALLIFPEASLAQVSVEERLADGQPPIVIAHRSAVLGGHPENTLAWLEAGIERGVDMLHINPQRTADGQYILMHDQTLNRMTDVESVYPEGAPRGPTRNQRGGRDYVGDYTLEEIRRLSVFNAKDGNVYSVPSLSDAIELVDGQTLIALGLKSYDIESLARTLQQHETHNLLLFELFYTGTNQSTLRELAEMTNLDVGVALFRSQNYHSDLEGIWAQLGPHLQMVSVGSAGLTPEFIARVEELDLHLAISGWAKTEDTALVDRDDQGPWLAVMNSGYSAVTDYPDLVLRLLSR
jgi:glycerophosphoryl diester phosphodiesterase